MGFVTGLKQFLFGKVDLLVISLGSLERCVFGTCLVSSQKVRIVVGFSSELILRNVVKVFAVVILVGRSFRGSWSRVEVRVTYRKSSC